MKVITANRQPINDKYDKLPLRQEWKIRRVWSQSLLLTSFYDIQLHLTDYQDLQV